MRELIAAFGPFVARLDTDDTHVTDRLKALDETRRIEVMAAAKKLAGYVRFVGGQEIRMWDSEPRPSGRQKSDTSEVAVGFGTLISSFGNANAASDFLRAYIKQSRRASRQKLLLRSLVPSAVASFEALLGVLLSEFLRVHPSAFARDEREFSLEDLMTLGSVPRAVDTAIANRVDAFMRQGLDDWRDWFEKNLKVNLSNLALGWDETQEVFQRRHVLIHNAGRVSPQYLQKLSGLTDPPAVGTELDVDQNYIETATDRLSTLGLLLAFCTSQKLRVNADSIGDEITQRVYDLMLEGRWAVVEKVCHEGQRMGLPGSSSYVLQANEWLAIKRQGRLDESRVKVAQWDTSALQSRFRIAQLALLDELDPAIPLIAEALRDGEVTEGALVEWPIFAELRAHPRFQELVTTRIDNAPSEDE